MAKTKIPQIDTDDDSQGADTKEQDTPASPRVKYSKAMDKFHPSFQAKTMKKPSRKPARKR